MLRCSPAFISLRGSLAHSSSHRIPRRNVLHACNDRSALEFSFSFVSLPALCVRSFRRSSVSVLVRFLALAQYSRAVVSGRHRAQLFSDVSNFTSFTCNFTHSCAAATKTVSERFSRLLFYLQQPRALFAFEPILSLAKCKRASERTRAAAVVF